MTRDCDAWSNLGELMDAVMETIKKVVTAAREYIIEESINTIYLPLIP